MSLHETKGARSARAADGKVSAIAARTRLNPPVTDDPMKRLRGKKLIRLKKVKPGDSIVVSRTGDVTVQIGRNVTVKLQKGK